MLGHPSSKPLLILVLDQEDYHLAPLIKKAVQPLVLSMHFVDRLIHIPVTKLTDLPALKLFIEWIQHIMPALISISIYQRLFPLPFGRLAFLLSTHLQHSVLLNEHIVKFRCDYSMVQQECEQGL